MAVDRNLLRYIPYVNLPGIKDDGRAIPLDAYFDSVEKVFKAPCFLKAEYHELQPADLIAFYYGTIPANAELDVSLSIFNTTNKNYPYNEITNTIWAFMQDFVALSGIIEFYFLLCERSSRNEDRYADYLVRNLLEYLLFVIRSSFDLMQKITKHVIYANSNFEIRDSFNRMFHPNGVFKSDKWPNIPEEIASFYEVSYPYFSTFKDLRDAISHKGCTLGPIYKFKGDFGLPIKLGGMDTVFTAFANYGVWPDDERKPNDIGSTLSFIIFAISKIISLSEVLSKSLLNSFPITPVIKDEYNVYFRGGYTHHLLNLEKLKSKPWLNTLP